MSAAAFNGFDELDRLLRNIPQRMAGDLQGALVKSALSAKRHVATGSNMSAAGKRGIRAKDGIIQIEPKSRRTPRRLDDVYLDFYSNWQGQDVPTKREAIARAIEEEIGVDSYRPRRARRLLIPTGKKVTTPSGKPKRRGGRKLDLTKLPGTRIVPGEGDNLLLIQRPKRTKRRRRRGKGRPDTVIGVLVKRADIETSLDFFGGWDRAGRERADEFGKVLTRVLRRRGR